MVKTFLLVAVLAYAGLAAFAYFLSERLIFQPPPPTYGARQLPIAMIPVGERPMIDGRKTSAGTGP